jgi:glucan-binding YG repeat protein
MCKGGCGELIKVKMYETPNSKNRVTLENVQKHPTNLSGAVLPHFDSRTEGYHHQSNSSLGWGDITLTDQASSGTDQEFQSDTNQTIRENSNKANINSAEPNYVPNKRAKEKVDGRNASTSVLQTLPETKQYNPTTRNTCKTKQTNPVNKQDIPNQPGQVDRTVSPDQQKNVNQISQETIEARFVGQTGTQTAANVQYCGGVSTQQPGACRNSVLI